MTPNQLVNMELIAQEIRGHQCTQRICRDCQNFVPGSGNAYADVVFVGEAPGEREDATGEPFVGKSGGLLDKLLDEAGFYRSEVFITNILKARPPQNRDPSPIEIAHHASWLLAQLKVIQPRLIVPLGRHALAFFLSGSKITELHGMLIQPTATTWLFPWFHPSAGLRDPAVKEKMHIDAQRLRETIDLYDLGESHHD